MPKLSCGDAARRAASADAAMYDDCSSYVVDREFAFTFPGLANFESFVSIIRDPSYSAKTYCTT
eukprot:6201394-Pleurochrysis_carterae.AAC.4